MIVLVNQVFTQTSEELEIINQINQIRTNPKSYIPKVESYIKSQEFFLNNLDKVKVTSVSGNSNKSNDMTNKKVLTGREVFIRNIRAAKDLINVLDTITPMKPLEFDSIMYVVTVSHGQYLKSVNQTGHYGPNGQTVYERLSHVSKTVSENCGTSLISLMVDAGIPGYGHRYNILNPKWSHISVYFIQNHPRYDNRFMIQNFRR